MNLNLSITEIPPGERELMKNKKIKNGEETYVWVFFYRCLRVPFSTFSTFYFYLIWWPWQPDILLYVILFQDCSFNKLLSNTAIKVSFQGNTRVQGTASKCNRWYFKFNNNECSGPMTIEAIVYNSWSSGNPNLLHHRSFEGYCENIPQGAVRVELWVGPCVGGYTLGDAVTGWNSVSRIMIEEVSRPQS